MTATHACGTGTTLSLSSMTQQLKFLHQSLRDGCYLMSNKEMIRLIHNKEVKALCNTIKRARSQRNATTNNEDFDYWHGIMEHHLEILGVLLKTGEKK